MYSFELVSDENSTITIESKHWVNFDVDPIGFDGNLIFSREPRNLELTLLFVPNYNEIFKPGSNYWSRYCFEDEGEEIEPVSEYRLKAYKDGSVFFTGFIPLSGVEINSNEEIIINSYDANWLVNKVGDVTKIRASTVASGNLESLISYIGFLISYGFGHFINTDSSYDPLGIIPIEDVNFFSILTETNRLESFVGAWDFAGSEYGFYGGEYLHFFAYKWVYSEGNVNEFITLYVKAQISSSLQKTILVDEVLNWSIVHEEGPDAALEAAYDYYSSQFISEELSESCSAYGLIFSISGTDILGSGNMPVVSLELNEDTEDISVNDLLKAYLLVNNIKLYISPDGNLSLISRYFSSEESSGEITGSIYSYKRKSLFNEKIDTEFLESFNIQEGLVSGINNYYNAFFAQISKKTTLKGQFNENILPNEIRTVNLNSPINGVYFVSEVNNMGQDELTELVLLGQ